MNTEVELVPFAGEAEHLRWIRQLIDVDLSEPYSIFTYRYFLRQWPQLCYLAVVRDASVTVDTDTATQCVGCVVGKQERRGSRRLRGYIAMVAVHAAYRRRGIGSDLVCRAVQVMQERGCTEVVLETEVCNRAALRMYEALGFLRDKRLERYYLNGSDAFRLKLPLVVVNSDEERKVRECSELF
ncbi:hypothetical protein CDCA_CDCA06G1742 [Cyanidium caldarium]|uniref:N-acetyltransferase domain-containing protein n=1 Tax=Cyanidium caldarium TaxID=2771 RepID=A0AAV9ITX7_CYACA|nr:hypothetical protein CDCA_CDCA06G1742 [Cyanidium caldarium]